MKNTLLLILFVPLAAFAQLEVPAIFSNHMVLQQELPVPVWGKGKPGASVTVTFKTQTISTEVAEDGTWRVDLAPETASFEPARLVIADADDTFTVDDVLVGEVWLCSGQSNMAWSVDRVKDADLEMLMADHPAVRLYKVPRLTASEPLFTSESQWQIADAEAVGAFSAVGYYFGRDLLQVLDVPVGLVDASWGGTPAIAWTREEAFPNHPLLTEKAGEWEGYVDTYDAKLAAWEEELKIWLEEKNITLYVRDPGISEEAKNWHESALNDFQWDKISLPALIENEIGEMDGAVWFRRRLELPGNLRGQELTLALGPIGDYDMTWVNGVLVGETGVEIDLPHTVDRRYTIPARLTRMGELTIAIRVFDRVSTGGFLGENKSMLIIGGTSAVRLGGPGWVYKVESQLESAVGEWELRQYPDAPKRPPEPDSPHRPASLANGMLATVAPYRFRGAIWYQGENDTGWVPEQYGERLRVMFDDWRAWWENDGMALGVVQLANFLEAKTEPSNDPWPVLRESQRKLVRDLPNSGLVVTIDLGEANDIHPRNKQEVGRRLARWALTDVYKKLGLRGGPELVRVRFLSDRIVLSYDQVGEGLHPLNNSTLGGYTLAGEDGVFVKADARIDGKDKVVLTSDLVAKPVHIRYAWQNNPIDANLVNKARLPASPFEVILPMESR